MPTQPSTLNTEEKREKKAKIIIVDKIHEVEREEKK